MRLFLLALVPAVSACASRAPHSAQGDEHGLTLGEGSRPLARYQYEAHVPAGVDPVHARSGYLHPIHTPSGVVVTGDYCASHRHQHGVFFAWTRTRFEGREVDFWNAAEQQGRVEARGVPAVVGTGLDARLAHVDLTAPAGPRTALVETWRVRACALTDATVIDLESEQAAPGSPLEVLQYHYGGFAVRGPESWEGPDGARALTSEGLGRVAGNASRARWVAMWGTTALDDGDERVATIAVLASPANPRAPEPVRIHPDNPYFCFAPCQLGAFTLESGVPRVTRYRIVAMDGPPDVARLEELWQELASRPGPLD